MAKDAEDLEAEIKELERELETRAQLKKQSHSTAADSGNNN